MIDKEHEFGEAVLAVIDDHASDWNVVEIVIGLASVAANVISFTDCPDCRKAAVEALEKMVTEVGAEADRIATMRGPSGSTSHHRH
jgi:hypothetical protein